MKSVSHSLLSLSREGREVIEIGNAELTSELTAFLGLFNAEPFFKQIELNVMSQNQVGVHWLIVDNNSADSSWEFAKSLAGKLQGPVTLVRNVMNIGGVGSLIAALDLAKGSWVATLHQDDAYYSNHLDELRKTIQLSRIDSVMVTTNMDSLKHKGLKGSRVPRANLLMQDKANVDVLLAHLRFHALPFPAAAFKSEPLASVPIGWHDNSFPDTELVCKLAALGSFKSSPVATMAYRENPLSESHILQTEERLKGQMLGLLRVFGSSEFKLIANSIEDDVRDAFFTHAAESVEIRLGRNEESRLTRRFLAEILAVEWNYSAKSVSHYLLREPDLLDGSFTSGFLRRTIEGKEKHTTVPTGSGEFGVVTARKKTWVQARVLASFFRITLYTLGKLGIRKDFSFEWRRR